MRKNCCRKKHFDLRFLFCRLDCFLEGPSSTLLSFVILCEVFFVIETQHYCFLFFELININNKTTVTIISLNLILRKYPLSFPSNKIKKLRKWTPKGIKKLSFKGTTQNVPFVVGNLSISKNQKYLLKVLKWLLTIKQEQQLVS